MSEAVTIQTRLQHGVAEVGLTLAHPMEAGDRRDERGDVIPAYFIQWLQVSHNGQEVLEAQWSTGIARDPQLVFYVAGAKPGDIVRVAWHDNKGQGGHRVLTLSG